MLSQPATKIFLPTTEPNASKWVSETIGEVEIERMRETHVHGTREGKSFTIDRQTEPLVMRSEISGLADKHAFLKLGNNVARFDFSYTDLPATAAAFQPRTVADDELTYDPEEDEEIANFGTPAPVAAAAAEPTSEPETATVPEPAKLAPGTDEEAVPHPAQESAPGVSAPATTSDSLPLFETATAVDDDPSAQPETPETEPQPILPHVSAAAAEAAARGYQRPAEL